MEIDAQLIALLLAAVTPTLAVLGVGARLWSNIDGRFEEVEETQAVQTQQIEGVNGRLDVLNGGQQDNRNDIRQLEKDQARLQGRQEATEEFAKTIAGLVKTA